MIIFKISTFLLVKNIFLHIIINISYIIFNNNY